VLRRTWYRRLARSNLLIVEARQRVAMQKALVPNLERAAVQISRHHAGAGEQGLYLRPPHVLSVGAYEAG
jgi:hypothetical protein